VERGGRRMDGRGGAAATSAAAAYISRSPAARKSHGHPKKYCGATKHDSEVAGLILKMSNRINVFGGSNAGPANADEKINPSLTWTTAKPACPSGTWPTFKTDRTDFPLYNGQCQALGIARH
jgi:hypothetical protein